MPNQKLSEIAANAQPLVETDKVYGIAGGATASINVTALSRAVTENMQKWVASPAIQAFTLENPVNMQLVKPSARVYELTHTDVTVPNAISLTNESMVFGSDDSVKLDYSNLNGTFGANLVLTPATNTTSDVEAALGNVTPIDDFMIVGVTSGFAVIQAIIGGGAPAQAFVPLPNPTGTNPIYAQFSGPDNTKVIQMFEGGTPIAGATLTVDVSAWGQTKIGAYMQNRWSTH